MNFTALIILTEFDNFFFKFFSRTTVFGKALDANELKNEEGDPENLQFNSLKEILKVQVTTAKMADLNIKKHKF